MTEKIDKRRKTFITYAQARKIVQQKQFKSKNEFKKWFDSSERKQVEGFPRHFEKVYQDEFSWDDFLGPSFVQARMEREEKIEYTYEQVRYYARKLKLKSMQEWIEYVKHNQLPKDMPTRPDVYFNRRQTWKGWPDFLGSRENRLDEKYLNESSKNIEEEFENVTSQTIGELPFVTFRDNVRRLMLDTPDQYRDWCKANVMYKKGYPIYPERYYSVRKTWTNWQDVLGIFDDQNVFMVPKCNYIDAKKFAQSLNISTDNEWRNFWLKHPNHRPDVPRYPDQYYGNYWEGWKKFLGVGIINRIDEELYKGNILWVAKTSKKVHNVYEIAIEPNGINALYSTIMLDNPDYTLVALFKYEDITIQHPYYNIKNTKEFILKLIDSFKDGTHPLYDGVIINNIWEFISELKVVFEEMQIQPPQHIQQRATRNNSIENDDTDTNSDSSWRNMPGLNLL